MREAQYYVGGVLIGLAVLGTLELANHASAQPDSATTAASAAYDAAVQQMREASSQLSAARAAATARAAADERAAAAAQAQAAAPATSAPVAVIQAAPGHSVLDFSPVLQELMQYLMVLMAAVFPALTAWLVYEFRRRTNVVVDQTAAAQTAQTRAAVVHTTAGLIKADIAAGRLTMADVLAADPEANRIHPVLKSRLSNAIHSLHPLEGEEDATPMIQRMETEADHMTYQVLGLLGHSMPVQPPPLPVAP